MRLNGFKAGDRVYQPKYCDGIICGCGVTKIFRIRYIGESLTILKPEFGGNEMAVDSNDANFVLYKVTTYADWKKAATDLYKAVRDGGLRTHTSHMDSAMARFEALNV